MSTGKFRIGSIPSASRGVERVSPNDSLDLAITKMITRDYSQLPVMTTDRVVKGVISWKSIGTTIQLGTLPKQVQDGMDRNVVILRQDDRILKAVKHIINYEFALVKDATEMVTGIISATDITEIFLAHSEPFMEIEQIETDLRQLIGDKLEGSVISHIQNLERPEDLLSDVSQFSFGEYGKWIQNEENWERLGLNVDRSTLIDRLTAVNKIRNQLMHFRVEALDETEIVELRQLSKFFRTVRKIRKTLGAEG